MLAADLAASLQYLDLSIDDFSNIVDVENTIVAKWILGDAAIPRWVDALTYAWGEHVDLLHMAACELRDPSDDDGQLSSASVLLASWQLARDAGASKTGDL